ATPCGARGGCPMNSFTPCPQCGGPAEKPGHRCLKCLVLEHRKLAGGTTGGGLTTWDQDCRVTMHFPDRNISRSYRSSRAAARRLMHNARRQGIGAVVTIDDQLSPDLPRLPMEHLYSPV